MRATFVATFVEPDTPKRWRDLPSVDSRDSVLECVQSSAAFRLA
jgi:hypothetical protein